MRPRTPQNEPMCETSEKCEKLFSRGELLPVSLEIGRRILGVFGYQEIRNIVFRPKCTRREIDSVINGEKLPTAELLLCIHRTTGVSIDWLLTGEGNKLVTYRNEFALAERRPRGSAIATGAASNMLATPVHPAQGA